MRLIDANSAKSSILVVADCITIDCDWLNGYKTGLLAATDAIDEIPTIDPVPQWIPVTERLPEDEWEKIRKEHSADLYPCLCYRRSYSRYDKWCMTKVYFDGVYFVDLDNVILDEYITHWMPLPEPPKDGGDTVD